MTLFSGYMYIELIEAKDLPDCDTAFFNFDTKDTSDPYAQVVLEHCVICKTACINNDISPKWQESYRIPVCHEASSIRIQVMDKDHVGGQCMGEVVLHPDDIIDGETVEGWHKLSRCSGELNFKIYFVPKQSIEHTFEVQECYFNMHEGCRLTLYQDAHCPALPFYESIIDPNGDAYVPKSAWVDLSSALNLAERFIYITGWSVCAETTLLRGCECQTDGGANEAVGEILKRKASLGVRVLILIWNEKMSTEVTPGLMGTHDEETRSYFEGTGVEVAVVPRLRQLDGLTSFLRDQFAQTCYTHHQKTIIMDAPALDELPRVIAFLGGLDITNGRWDTPEHNIYRTLKDVHDGDFYNGCVQTTSDCGPRQPWHDIHCQVEGPVVKDLLDNFTERWRYQVSEKMGRLLNISDEEFAVSSPVNCENESEIWNAQIFRSITSDSALFNFDKIFTIPKRNGKFVDDSIHRAYIHQIRRADRFIYIENQYFLGSAFAWHKEKDTKAYHLIPREITQRIVEKIAAGEDFRVYIVIPMFPEGDPASKPVQEILHWQHSTMEMMYRKIANALAEYEIEALPTDYLTFFCLGKRESPDDIPEGLGMPAPDTPLQKVRDHARFMVYVHSKMMIIDDDYIIIGSANINQRSMGGTRDSEIAIGAFQPSYMRETADGEPVGAIHQFRKALWAEHLGTLEDCHNDPGTLECIQSVREIANNNWTEYVADEPNLVEGHLLTYPVQVLQDGDVTALEGDGLFPDLEATILGAASYLPNKLTT